MEGSLQDKVTEELDMLESIFSEDNVIAERAMCSLKKPDIVECVFKLQPNTGFNSAKIAVIIFARFIF